MDMISHLFTLSVITDDFGQTAQFYMAHADHHCGPVVQPVLNYLTCMHAWCTAPMHHRMMSTNLYLPWPKAQTATIWLFGVGAYSLQVWSGFPGTALSPAVVSCFLCTLLSVLVPGSCRAYSSFSVLSFSL